MVILDKNARGLLRADTFTRLSRIRLISLVLLLCAAFSAQAQDCSDYANGTLDGFAGDVAPSQLQFDRNCTARNYPASNLLTFENLSIVPAGKQFIIEITVVLEDTSTSTPSTQFVNTAKRDFGTYEIARQ